MKSTTTAIIIAGLLVAGAIMYSRGGNAGGVQASVDNVSFANGRQVIDIVAGSGYSPRLTRAKADTPTTLRFQTRSAFDCSNVLRIPSIGFAGNLSPEKPTEIEIPAIGRGKTLQGMCAMGMYRFAIEFE